MSAYKRVVLSVLVLAVAFLNISPSVWAQQQSGNGLKISPVRSERTIERGESDTVEVTVENVTELPITAQFFINDFLPGEDGSATPQIILNDEDGSQTEYSIKSFVSAPENISLDPGEKQTLTLTLSIPESASPGSYFGALRAAPVSSDQEASGTQVGLTASVASLILVTVPGDVVELVTLKDITVLNGDNAGSFFDSAPDTVAVSLNNEGNVFTKPFGSVTIEDWSGNVVHQYELNSAEPRGNVLPASYRTFENGVENIGSFGKYTVKANIAYGDGGGNILTAEKTFWVVPYRAILIGAVALVLLVLGATRGIKAYNRSVVNRSKSQRVSKKK